MIPDTMNVQRVIKANLTWLSASTIQMIATKSCMLAINSQTVKNIRMTAVVSHV